MGSKIYRIVLIVVVIASLTAVQRVQVGLNHDRVQYGLVNQADLGANAPPFLAFTTVALGGFRGLIANILWVRATDLQEDDKFFEMVQLSDWITKLEPHFAQVWSVEAWNMAYNISVKFEDEADRWRWVQKGIQLLRDEGLPQNPNEALIYSELGWFFFHKMGANLDDAHLYYKKHWARQMEDLLGARPDFDQLIHPTTDEMKKKVQILHDVYKLDPVIMKEVDEKYGPLEWRLPETHAIYWAHLGLKKSKPSKDTIQLRRLIYQSMQLAFLRGTLIENKLDHTYTFGPNLNFAKNADATYEEMEAADAEMRENIKIGHRNFLKNVPYLLYTQSRNTEAEEWLKVLKTKFPGVVPANETLDQYAIEHATEDLADNNRERTMDLIQGFFKSEFVSLIQDDNDKRANIFRNLASQVRARYEQRVKGGEKRVGLPPLLQIREDVLNECLNTFPPLWVARLRTRLNLAAPSAAPATAPASQLNPPAQQ